jgi:hypothetical protein
MPDKILNSYRYKIYISDGNVVKVEEKDVPSYYFDYFDEERANAY